MYIYKITNILNNKIYIGQTIQPIKQRFYKHINSSLNHENDTHLARAIRKYGFNNFVCEIIDYAKTQAELNDKEIFWINHYNSTNYTIGYNETDGSIGGNTYKYKSDKEIDMIAEKIRNSKKYGNNPMARSVKCKNIETNEELFFDSLKECQEYFKEKDHNFITRRCLHKTKYLYKGIWMFAYKENKYDDFTTYKNIKRKKSVYVENLLTKESGTFSSFAEAERFFKLPLKALSGKAYRHNKEKSFVTKNYKITLL